MSLRTPGRISVIVPVYNVEQYLPACLDSLLQQTYEDLDILCVNDGSTDSTSDVIARYVEMDPRIRRVDIENGGLGHARNVGLAHTDGEFVVFVDGDDTVPDTAFARMAGTLSRTGSDFVTGRVFRMAGVRSWPSGLHEKCHPRIRLGTHIGQTTSLLYDTTAWNKMFRRDFWDSQKLEFPEGVLYEDIPVMMRAHVLARAVDVITDFVYSWRRREDGSRSITQRRYELPNLQDRMWSLVNVREFLTDQAMPRLRDLHDRKSLELDIGLYMREYLEADPDYQQRFVELVGSYVASVQESVLERLSPDLRIKYYLAAQGDAGRLADLLRYERDNGGKLPSMRQGVNIRLDLGPVSDAVPNRLADLRRSLPLRSGVDRVHWQGDNLVIEGYAFIDAVPSWRFSSTRRLKFVEQRSGRTFSVWLTPQEHPEATAVHGRPGRSYRWSGFRAEVPASQLAPQKPGAGSTWNVIVQVMTPFAHRGATLGPPRAGAAWFCQPHRSENDVLYTVHWNAEKWLTVQAAPFHAHLTEATSNGDSLGLWFVAKNTGGQQPEALVLRGQTGTEPIVAPLSDVTAFSDGSYNASLRLPLDQLTMDEKEQTWASWRMSLRTASREIAVASSLPAELVTRGSSGTVEVRPNRRGQADIVVSRPRVLVERAEWRGKHLVVSGTTTVPDGALPQLLWANPRGDRLVPQERREGDRFESAVDLGSVPGPNGPHPVPAGRWSLSRRLPDGRTERVPVAYGRQGEIECAVGTEINARLWVDRKSLVALSVYTLPLKARGKYNQHRLQTVEYDADRRAPLTDAVLFESWQGKQYSDNPRALIEEALRRGDERELLVSVRDDSVVTPEGTRPVRRWSREWYRALGTSRLVVSNDAMPPSFVKRPDQRYLQTWHGTPLKRIGFDMERIHFKNKGYLDDFAREVAKWDWLVSPNPYSTELLRTAFRFDGEILETGYPRNDIFSRPEADAERERVREWLGIEPGTTAVLWTPTWRDNQFDAGGGYSFPLALDPAQVEKQLGPGYVILYRGHHLVADSVGTLQSSGGTFINVSGYPDVRDLYLAADALITDYSSTMFDFALTGRPILLFAWDLEDYRDVLRGFYLDIESIAPGPLLRSSHELVESLLDLPGVERTYGDKLAEFRGRFCGLEDGNAAARVWDRISELS